MIPLDFSRSEKNNLMIAGEISLDAAAFTFQTYVDLQIIEDCYLSRVISNAVLRDVNDQLIVDAQYSYKLQQGSGVFGGSAENDMKAGGTATPQPIVKEVSFGSRGISGNYIDQECWLLYKENQRFIWQCNFWFSRIMVPATEGIYLDTIFEFTKAYKRYG